MQAKSVLNAVADQGLEGDQAYGRRSRQVLLVDLEVLRKLHLEPGDLRENVVISGLPVDSLPIGTRLQAGEVLLEIIDTCAPCKKLEDIRPGLMTESENMRGMLAVVERGGTLREGDPITLLG